MDFVDKIKEIGSVAVEKGKELGNVAINKGKELGNLAKLKIDIVNLESEIEKCKIAIGNIIYDEKISVENASIKELIKKISDYTKELNSKKKELNNES